MFIYLMSSSLLCFRLSDMFNTEGKASILKAAPLGLNDVTVDMAFMWCVAFPILGFLFPVVLKKNVVFSWI